MNSFHDLNSIIQSISANDLWVLKGLCEKEIVKQFKITHNYVGERAVDLAIKTYNNNPTLPSLRRAENNTKEWDAYSLAGERYSIKGLKGNNKVTSSFCGFNQRDNSHLLFDKVILVRMNEYYMLEELLQISTDVFCKIVKYNKRDKNYKLYLTNKLREVAEFQLFGE